MQIKEWYNDASTYFEFEGHQYFYKIEGSNGPYLLLVHGFPTSSWDWHKMWPILIQNFKCIALDSLGFGYSDKPNDFNYTIHHQARAHEALLKLLSVKECHILAHDYGNTVTQELLAAFQDRKREKNNSLNFLSICFLNGGLFPEMHRPVLTQILLNSPIGFLFNKGLNRKSLRKNFDKIFGKVKASDQEIDEFYGIMNYKNGRSILHRLIKYIRDRKQHRDRWVTALQNANIPLRLIDGPEDPISGIHLVHYYRKMIDNADAIVLDGIGHYPQTEDPENVLKYFLEFHREAVIP